MSYAKGKNFNVVFLPLRYSAGDTYRGSGLVFFVWGGGGGVCVCVCVCVLYIQIHSLSLIQPSHPVLLPSALVKAGSKVVKGFANAVCLLLVYIHK